MYRRETKKVCAILFEAGPAEFAAAVSAENKGTGDSDRLAIVDGGASTRTEKVSPESFTSMGQFMIAFGPLPCFENEDGRASLLLRLHTGC